MRDSLTLRIVVQGAPADVEFGLQKGRGSKYETVQKQRSDGTDLRFEFAVALKGDGAAPDFAGPFVQGPRGERFVYLDIGSCAGQADGGWSRRLKIPLRGITWGLIEGLGEGRSALEVRVAGTGRDGGPSCGSVRSPVEWEAVGLV